MEDERKRNRITRKGLYIVDVGERVGGKVTYQQKGRSQIMRSRQNN